VTPNPGFKVTVYVQVEYLRNAASLLNSRTHNYRSPGALPKTCKKIGVVADNFCKKCRKFQYITDGNEA